MNKRKRKKSITITLNRIAIIPLLCLGICVMLVSSGVIYQFMVSETKDGLKNLAHSLQFTCSNERSGAFALEEGILTKGGTPFFHDFSIVDNIKNISGVDATIFYGNTRMLTSIKNNQGNRVIGTKASETVTEAVFNQGGEYFSTQVSVNGTPYFGYYVPLLNEDHSIVGMVFVGKTRALVVGAIRQVLVLVLIPITAIILISYVLVRCYAKKMIFSLQKTKEFLGDVAKGNNEAQIDSYILEREDEIGEMGRFASILQKSIIGLVGTDPLTGLANRRSGMLFLENALSEYEKSSHFFVVGIADIDNFKNINDTYGHLGGDVVLKKLSAVFKEHMNNHGFVARWGGEEFLFLYEGVGKEQAGRQANKLLEELKDIPFVYHDKKIQVTITMGLALYDGKEGIEELLRRADNNLYIGKGSGKNRIIA